MQVCLLEPHPISDSQSPSVVTTAAPYLRFLIAKLATVSCRRGSLVIWALDQRSSANICIRIRRVKCDEAKPLCDRCTSTGRTCDGYTLPTVSPHQHTRTENLTVALSTNAPCSALEKRTFDFFRSRTTPCISGYFNDSVWDRFVLQVSQSEPTIRYVNSQKGSAGLSQCIGRGSSRSHDIAGHVNGR